MPHERIPWLVPNWIKVLSDQCTADKLSPTAKWHIVNFNYNCPVKRLHCKSSPLLMSCVLLRHSHQSAGIVKKNNRRVSRTRV